MEQSNRVDITSTAVKPTDDQTPHLWPIFYVHPEHEAAVKPIIKNSSPEPIKRNFKQIRKDRQDKNNETVRQSILTNNDQIFDKNINPEEYARILEYTGCSSTQMKEKCIKDDTICKLLSCLISKNASKQGTIDETDQLNICNETANKCGIEIEKLTATALRPTKDGSIVSKTEMTSKQIPMDKCLKSFDAKIYGNINGCLASKIVYRNGGHQVNVFEEMDTLAEWWETHKCETTEILIVLIDTDLSTKLEKLNEKYKHVVNVKVFNHVEFQQYMIDTYYTDESK